jgi:hypothetical protein
MTEGKKKKGGMLEYNETKTSKGKGRREVSSLRVLCSIHRFNLGGKGFVFPKPKNKM